VKVCTLDGVLRTSVQYTLKLKVRKVKNLSLATAYSLQEIRPLFLSMPTKHSEFMGVESLSEGMVKAGQGPMSVFEGCNFFRRLMGLTMT